MALTFSAGCTKSWKSIVDGADFSSVGIQLAEQEAVKVAVATVQPADDSKDFITMFLGNTKELVLDLEADEKLYIKGRNDLDVAVRGYRKKRT